MCFLFNIFLKLKFNMLEYNKEYTLNYHKCLLGLRDLGS
jgi:hypothetical protein